MCWEGKLSDQRVAKQDIVVYKVMERMGRNNYRSPFMKEHYKMGYRYSIKDGFGILGNIGGLIINRGFHCYSQNAYASFDKADNRICVSKIRNTLVDYDLIYRGWKRVIVECVIPKGTTYYINKRSEIVTECLYFRWELGVPLSKIPTRFRKKKKNHLFK